MITNPNSGTNVHEIAAGIYRVNTPVEIPNGPGRFNFNQYLIADEEPLVFDSVEKLFFHGRWKILGVIRREACFRLGGIHERVDVAMQDVPSGLRGEAWLNS